MAAGADFSLLVTDLVMPGVDGLALIRALRAMPRHAALPILVLSTEGDDGVRARVRGRRLRLLPNRSILPSSCTPSVPCYPL